MHRERLAVESLYRLGFVVCIPASDIRARHRHVLRELATRFNHVYLWYGDRLGEGAAIGIPCCLARGLVAPDLRLDQLMLLRNLVDNGCSDLGRVEVARRGVWHRWILHRSDFEEFVEYFLFLDAWKV